MARAMHLARLVTISLLLSVTVLAWGAEKSARPSAVGTWKLDVAKSSFGNMPTPKAEQLVVTTDTRDALKWLLVGAEADGKTYASSYDGPIDGKEHPLKSSEAGSMIAYTRTGSGVLHWLVKDDKGAVVETALAALSPDGKTMTIKGTANSPRGEMRFVSIFEKVK